MSVVEAWLARWNFHARFAVMTIYHNQSVGLISSSKRANQSRQRGLMVVVPAVFVGMLAVACETRPAPKPSDRLVVEAGSKPAFAHSLGADANAQFVFDAVRYEMPLSPKYACISKPPLPNFVSQLFYVAGDDRRYRFDDVQAMQEPHWSESLDWLAVRKLAPSPGIVTEVDAQRMLNRLAKWVPDHQAIHVYFGELCWPTMVWRAAVGLEGLMDDNGRAVWIRLDRSVSGGRRRRMPGSHYVGTIPAPSGAKILGGSIVSYVSDDIAWWSAVNLSLLPRREYREELQQCSDGSQRVCKICVSWYLGEWPRFLINGIPNLSEVVDCDEPCPEEPAPEFSEEATEVRRFLKGGDHDVYPIESRSVAALFRSYEMCRAYYPE